MINFSILGGAIVVAISHVSSYAKSQRLFFFFVSCFCVFLFLFSALFSLFLYEHFCVSCFSPFRLGWQGGWQGGLARRELARGGGLVLGVKELRLGIIAARGHLPSNLQTPK